MKKKIIKNTTLTVVLQNTVEFSENQCLVGVFSLDTTKKEALFEEEIRKGRAPRNPKLYDGKFISLVRMQNGKYQCHLKTFNPCSSGDAKALATEIYHEMINAFQRFE